MITKNKIATLCLTLGMFFNPFGFDALLLIAIKLTGGYWNAIALLYCLVGLFVILFCFLHKRIYLMLALFINPFGYDALFAWTLHHTSSFWVANSIFYGIAMMFFGVYFYLTKQNPIKFFVKLIVLIFQFHF